MRCTVYGHRMLFVEMSACRRYIEWAAFSIRRLGVVSVRGLCCIRVAEHVSFKFVNSAPYLFVVFLFRCHEHLRYVFDGTIIACSVNVADV